MRWLWLLVGVTACGTTPTPDTQHGGDQAQVKECLSCHRDLAAKWSRAPSHALLLDCGTCHELQKKEPGPGHRASPTCDQCHSAATHEALRCVSCHDVHGSPNAFLFRPEVSSRAPVRFTKAEGASPEGLVRASVAGQQAGTGACEVCHAATRYYTSAGTAATHDTAWCIDCHSHEAGFRPTR